MNLYLILAVIYANSNYFFHLNSYLYTVLADPSASSVPVLIACNKQDETFAKGNLVIKPLLEKELWVCKPTFFVKSPVIFSINSIRICVLFRNLVRNTRQNQLQSVDSSTSDIIFLGKQGKDFEFTHLSQPISIVECSGKESDIDSLHKWLKSLN